ncbi:MAG: FHA domain-containing protein [Deltaproteobacteria bacterium]|nr:FHA domain-containing protein [Deltaproteobacteria bacterium]
MAMGGDHDPGDGKKAPDESWEDQTATNNGLDLGQLRTGARIFVLHQDTGPDAPQDHMLVGDQTIVGRSTEADIQIDAADLSRKHMLLYRDGDLYHCKDLDSRNGVHLNGTLIASATLQDGDVLQLGSVIFFFRETR